jgi:hypothetical protein
VIDQVQRTVTSTLAFAATAVASMISRFRIEDIDSKCVVNFYGAHLCNYGPQEEFSRGRAGRQQASAMTQSNSG